MFKKAFQRNHYLSEDLRPEAAVSSEVPDRS